MKEDDFDFNTYSKSYLSEEQEAEMLKECQEFYNFIENEKRKSFYSLPTDEHKVAWLKKATMNAITLNNLLLEFLPPLIKHLPQTEEEKNTDGFDTTNIEEIKTLLQVPIAHTSYHLKQHVCLIYSLKKYMERARTEKEEIRKLQEMLDASNNIP